MNEEIKQLQHQISQREKLIARLREHPHFVQFQELMKVQENGAFVAQTISAEMNVVNQMKKRVQQIMQQPPPVPQYQPQQDAFNAPLSNQLPQQQQPQPAPVPVPIQQPQPQLVPEPTVEQQPQPAPEPTVEQQAQELFDTSKEDVGIDENIEGIPEFEDLEEFEEPKK